jgi:hypothetical protein
MGTTQPIYRAYELLYQEIFIINWPRFQVMKSAADNTGKKPPMKQTKVKSIDHLLSMKGKWR